MEHQLDDLAREVLRARDRLHSLETTTAGLVLGQRAVLDKLDALGSRVQAMSTADEIADAVEAKRDKARVRTLTVMERVILSVAAAGTFATALHSWIG